MDKLKTFFQLTWNVVTPGGFRYPQKAFFDHEIAARFRVWVLRHSRGVENINLRKLQYKPNK